MNTKNINVWHVLICISLNGDMLHPYLKCDFFDLVWDTHLVRHLTGKTNIKWHLNFIHQAIFVVKHALMTCEKSKRRVIVTNITAVIVLSGYDSPQSAKRNKDKVNMYLHIFVVNELHHAAGLAYPQSECTFHACQQLHQFTGSYSTGTQAAGRSLGSTDNLNRKYWKTT